MKKYKVYSWIVALVMLVSLVGSLVYVEQLGEPNDEFYAFVTIGLDQEVLANESSSYEVQRAVEHFSDVILGWTVEPSFKSDFNQIFGDGFSFSGKRQEKQNLLFTIYADPLVTSEGIEYGNILVDLIDERLADYNSSTNSAYVIAIDEYSFVEGSRSDSRIVLGALLISFILSVFVLMLWDYAAPNCR